MKKSIILTISIFSILFIIGCNNETYDPFHFNDPPDQTDDPVPIEIIDWEPDAFGNIRFSVNDPDYLTDYGSTGWIWGNYEDNTMDTLETELFKISGNRNYGYGLIFCVQGDTDAGDLSDDTGDNFLMVLMDIDGNYMIAKVVERRVVYPLIKPWTYTSLLMKGYNVSNKLKVTYEGNQSFSLVINDQTDDAVPFQYNYLFGEPEFAMTGRYGYIVTLAPDEDFPETPVTVGFSQIIPSDILIPDKNDRGMVINNSRFIINKNERWDRLLLQR